MATHLDQGQVIPAAYDEPNEALRVNIVAGSVVATNPSVSPTGDPVPANATLVGGENPSGDLEALQVDGSGALITALPSNAAQESGGNLDTIAANTADVATETTLSALNTKVVTVDTDNVTIVGSTLPTGAATEATLLAFSAKTAGALVPEAFDYQEITYVGATTDIDTVTYKTGGAGGTTVAILTLGYDGSNRLSTVTRT